MRLVLHNRIQAEVILERKNPKENNNCILSSVSDNNTDHVLFQVCFYLTSPGSLSERLLGRGQGAELVFIGQE